MTTPIHKLNIETLERRAKIAEIASKLTYLRPCEAACYANVGESTLWQWISRGAIPSSKDGGNVRILRRDIDKFFAERRRGSTVSE